MKIKKNKFGFTLIELLIAVTIGMVAVGIGSVALNNFNDQQKVETTKQELLANLRFARNYAITNQIPTGVRRDTDRITVTFNTNGLITMGIQNSGNVDIGYTFFSKDITPDGVFITTDKQIKFSITDGRSINGIVSVGVSGNGLKNIKIDQSGLIYEE